MMPAEMLCVAAGGALGALCRHGVSLWCADRFGKAFPCSTFSMDTLAAFHAGHPAKAMLNIGLNTTLCLTATAAAYFLIVP